MTASDDAARLRECIRDAAPTRTGFAESEDIRALDRLVAILHDDCEVCEERAEHLGLGLDGDRFAAAWKRMVEVEYDYKGGYRGENEAKLCRSLYKVALLCERHPHIIGVVRR